MKYIHRLKIKLWIQGSQVKQGYLFKSAKRLKRKKLLPREMLEFT